MSEAVLDTGGERAGAFHASHALGGIGSAGGGAGAGGSGGVGGGVVADRGRTEGVLRTLARWSVRIFRGIVAALLFMVLLAVLRVLFDKPIYLMQLQARPAPVAVAVPVQGVAIGALRDAWGNPRSGGRRHEGIDIFAPAGTPVLSATEGLVTRIGENSLGGQVVWVMGPGGQRHYYAHLRDFAPIAVGQKVTAGTRLGSVGNTGNARGTPPHLHYGVYERIGGAVNPYPLLRASTRTDAASQAMPGARSKAVVTPTPKSATSAAPTQSSDIATTAEPAG